jgi:hypothetical protein
VKRYSGQQFAILNAIGTKTLGSSRSMKNSSGKFSEYLGQIFSELTRLRIAQHVVNETHRTPASALQLRKVESHRPIVKQSSNSIHVRATLNPHDCPLGKLANEQSFKHRVHSV